MSFVKQREGTEIYSAMLFSKNSEAQNASITEAFPHEIAFVLN